MQECLCQRRGVCLCSALCSTHLFFTRQRMTHSASWMERSASSITSLLEPRTTMLTVFPGLAQPVICTERHHTFTGRTNILMQLFWSGGGA